LDSDTSTLVEDNSCPSCPSSALPPISSINASTDADWNSFGSLSPDLSFSKRTLRNLDTQLNPIGTALISPEASDRKQLFPSQNEHSSQIIPPFTYTTDTNMVPEPCNVSLSNSESQENGIFFSSNSSIEVSTTDLISEQSASNCSSVCDMDDLSVCSSDQSCAIDRNCEDCSEGTEAVICTDADDDDLSIDEDEEEEVPEDRIGISRPSYVRKEASDEGESSLYLPVSPVNLNIDDTLTPEDATNHPSNSSLKNHGNNISGGHANKNLGIIPRIDSTSRLVHKQTSMGISTSKISSIPTNAPVPVKECKVNIGKIPNLKDNPLPVSRAKRGYMNDIKQTSNSVSSKATCKVYLLIIQPSAKIFELIQVKFDPANATVRTLVELVPTNCTEPVLSDQVHIGLCRPEGSSDISSLTDLNVRACGIERDGSCARIHNGEILVAIPKGYNCSSCQMLAQHILKNPKLVKLLSRDDPLAPKFPSQKPRRRRRKFRTNEKRKISGKVPNGSEVLGISKRGSLVSELSKYSISPVPEESNDYEWQKDQERIEHDEMQDKAEGSDDTESSFLTPPTLSPESSTIPYCSQPANSEQSIFGLDSVSSSNNDESNLDVITSPPISEVKIDREFSDDMLDMFLLANAVNNTFASSKKSLTNILVSSCYTARTKCRSMCNFIGTSRQRIFTHIPKMTSKIVVLRVLSISFLVYFMTFLKNINLQEVFLRKEFLLEGHTKSPFGAVGFFQTCFLLFLLVIGQGELSRYSRRRKKSKVNKRKQRRKATSRHNSSFAATLASASSYGFNDRDTSDSSSLNNTSPNRSKIIYPSSRRRMRLIPREESLN